METRSQSQLGRVSYPPQVSGSRGEFRSALGIGVPPKDAQEVRTHEDFFSTSSMKHYSGCNSSANKLAVYHAATYSPGLSFSFLCPSHSSGLSFLCMPFRLPTRDGLLTGLSLDSMFVFGGVSCQPSFRGTGQSLNSCSTSAHCSQVPRMRHAPCPCHLWITYSEHRQRDGGNIQSSRVQRATCMSTASGNPSREHTWGSSGLQVNVSELSQAVKIVTASFGL